MPYARRRSYYGRRKPRYTKRRRMLRRRNSTRRLRKGKYRQAKTLFGGGKRIIVPQKAYITATFSKTGSMFSISGTEISPVQAFYINDLDHFEDNGMRSLNLERVSNLYERYQVMAAKIRVEGLQTVAGSLGVEALAAYSLHTYRPEQVVTSANALPAVNKQAALLEIPGGSLVLPPGKVSGEKWGFTRYIKMRNVVGPGYTKDWQLFSAPILHGVSDNWDSPPEKVYFEWGIAPLSGNFSASENLGQYKMSITVYLKMWNSNIYPGAA